MHERDGLAACVEFATGAVSFIGYKLARTDLTRYGLGIRPGYIILVLREEWVDVSVLTHWKQMLPGLYQVREARDGLCLSVAFSRSQSTAASVHVVIRALKAAKYLSRHQELAAYIGLDIPYSET